MDAIYDIDELWTLEMDSEHLSIRLSDMHDPHPECWSPLDTGRKANVVRHDALLSGQPIKTEHSYSLCSDGDSLPDSPGSMHHHSPSHHQQQQQPQQHHLLNQQQHHLLNQQAHQLNNHLNNHLQQQQQQQQQLLQQNHHQSQPNHHHQQQQQQQQQQHISHHSHHSHIQRHDDIGDGVDDDYDVDDIFPRKATLVTSVGGALTQKPATVASYHVSTANGNKRQRSASPATQSAVSPAAIHLPTSNMRAGRNAIAVRQQQQQQNQLQQQQKQKQRQQRQTYATARDTNDININDVLDAAMLHVKHEPMSPSDTGSCASPSPSSNNDLELGGRDGGAVAMMLGEQRTAMSEDDDDDDDEHEMDDDEDDDDEEEDVNAEDGDVNVDTSGYTALQQQKLLHHQQQLQRKQHQQQQQHRRIGATGKLNIKMEPQQLTSTPMTSQSAFGLPPTPSSSSSSDDFESNSSNSPLQQHTAGGMLLLSPSGRRASQAHSNRSSPSSSPSVGRGGGGGGGANSSSSSTSSVSSGVGYVGTSSRQPIHTPLISSQPKGSTGSLLLTEEEKRTLQAEGYPIPTRLPLTKAEEKSLKKIRRKIKNKISAQESRRKKKEYMDQLERKVEILEAERNGHQANSQTYQRRVTQLEDQNAAFRKRIEALEAKLSMVN